MESADLDRFIDEATSLTAERNAQAERAFGLGHHARYHLDLETRTLTFFDANDAPVVTSRAVPVGSLARPSQSWLWSWENESMPKDATEAMLAVAHFGRENGIPALERNFSPCGDSLAGALAAISLKLLDAQGVYRIEQTKTRLFLLLFDLKSAGAPLAAKSRGE